MSCSTSTAGLGCGGAGGLGLLGGLLGREVARCSARCSPAGGRGAFLGAGDLLGRLGAQLLDVGVGQQRRDVLGGASGATARAVRRAAILTLLIG